MSMEDVTPEPNVKPLPSETIKKGFGGGEGGLEMREPKEEQ